MRTRLVLPETITTDRLRLRPYSLDDLDDVLAYAQDPEWARFLPVPQPYLREHGESWLADQMKRDRERSPLWAIEREGVVVGGINLGHDIENRTTLMGYSIAPGLWGQGLTTEAASAVIDAVFTHLSDLNKVRASANPKNVASVRVMEKLGMSREAWFHQQCVFRGEVEDEVWYAILREEWERLHDQAVAPG